MFSDKIKQLRLDAELTQDDLARYFNLDRATISRYESGDREPNLEFLIKVSDYFNVSIDYLLDRTRIPTPQYTLYQLQRHPSNTLKKLNEILLKFKNEKYIELVYSILFPKR